MWKKIHPKFVNFCEGMSRDIIGHPMIIWMMFTWSSVSSYMGIGYHWLPNTHKPDVGNNIYEPMSTTTTSTETD